MKTRERKDDSCFCRTETELLFFRPEHIRSGKIHDGNIRTTKSDPALHGFGLSNIKLILNKYAADFIMDYADGWFQFTGGGVMNFMEDVFISEKMGCEKPNARIFDAALRALGVENREHVLMVGDSLASDIQGGSNAGLDTCWYNPNHAENPGKVIPTYEIASLEELYPLVMEQEELANVAEEPPHQC